jgi:hypothetical protein
LAPDLLYQPAVRRTVAVSHYTDGAVSSAYAEGEKRSRARPGDFVGLVLVGTGLAAFQVVLDKGPRDQDKLAAQLDLIHQAVLQGIAD